MNKIIVAFDLYGTLLSTASIANKLASHFGYETADSIAAVWRKYQLEYTWRLNSMSESPSDVCRAFSALTTHRAIPVILRHY
jgi:2-haloacid dehalogenase